MSEVFVVLLTSAVIGAFITSITNIIISFINSHKLKSIENIKRNHEIEAYRYKELYKILSNWTELNNSFIVENKSVSQIASERLIDIFISDHRKYEMMEPLLSEKYKNDLIKKYEEVNAYLIEVIDLENISDYSSNMEAKEKHKLLFSKFKCSAADYDNHLLNVLSSQLSELLNNQ